MTFSDVKLERSWCSKTARSEQETDGQEKHKRGRGDQFLAEQFA